MEIPRIAVVITCWNYEAYVANAIRSVVSQGCEECELVVVDDGSTDSSWDVIQREGVTAYRIENSGQRAAGFYGLERTHAPFILFLDADDELAPGSLATILSKLDSDVAKLQFSLTRIDHQGNVTSSGTTLEAFRDRHTIRDRVLRTGVYTSPPTSGNVFRRDVCEYLREMDYDRAVDGIILFIAPFMGDVVSLSDKLGRYRVHGRNISGLGRPVDPVSLRAELHRFVLRMEHLRQILTQYDRAEDLVAPEKAYFYLERSFYLAIAEGRRPSASILLPLLGQLWREYYPVKTKVTITAFCLLTMVLPNRNARRGLAYRLNAGKRSTIGLLQALI
ncbi:glycosyltransferase family 2 protein [Rhizobium sp. P44RR-XXIV]|uniref:glycosyltransferase family 2 protein n=1 Tax=Rhizobium sp. P44RR-XXIV TaxID=1921145 RepID=UPI0009853C28|nr:glycosyltransferase family 2 protein [Rhizobium sp. P44RR-XXIV]TIX90880.1 glycosyltransferase family 2 protein [Rhizobium sp. P44RR-XXIV]